MAKKTKKQVTKAKKETPFRAGSKHEFVYQLLVKQKVTLDQLVEILTKKFGEKTAKRGNAVLYVKNIANKTGKVAGNSKDGWSIA